MINYKRLNILYLTKDIIITFAISFFVFLIFLRSNFFTFGSWPYGHAGDVIENVRTAFFSSWGYLPLKDIAINHMPGVPDLLFLGSKFGRFFPRKFFQDSVDFKIIELAEKIKELIDPNLKFINKPLPGDDLLQRKPVIDLAKTELSWEPLVNLSGGLIKTINYFKRVL